MIQYHNIVSVLGSGSGSGSGMDEYLTVFHVIGDGVCCSMS